MSDAVADILGQNTEQLVSLTSWVGEHPTDGRDFPFLLLAPHAHGIADKMRSLAALLQLSNGSTTAPPDYPGLAVPPDTVHATITGQGAPHPGGPGGMLGIDHAGTLTVHYGDTARMQRPIDTEWATIAGDRRQAMLVVGVDGWIGRVDDLDTYLSRAHRLHLGLIRVVAH